MTALNGMGKGDEPVSTLPPSAHCLICGQHNPAGMQVRFERDDQGVRARLRPPAHFQGFAGLLHGGAVTALLDDAMWWAVYATREVITLTADLQVRFRAPVPVGADLVVTARLVAERPGRLYRAQGQVLDASGRLLAEAEGKFLPAPPGLAATLRGQLGESGGGSAPES
nr:MAG: PaaI family thioesterase [Bacillota bacterium]